MLKAKFYLKDSKESESLIILSVYQRSKKLVSISTGLKVSPNLWNKKSQEIKSGSPVSEEANKVLNNYKNKVLNLSLRAEEYESTEELKRVLKLNLTGLKSIEKKLSFYDCFDLYCNEKKKLLTHGTMRVYYALPEKYRKYEKDRNIKLSMDYWDKDTMRDFQEYLTSSGFLNDTVNNQLKATKAFLNWGYRKHHNNQKFKGYKINWGNHAVISLTSEELNRIYELDLSHHKKLEKVKDLFCIGCFTAQRYSDLKQLEKSQIHGKYWIINSEKTRKLLRIPLSNKVLHLLSKYDFNPPKISNQKFNIYLKEVGKLAEITEPIQKVSYSGHKKKVTTAPKYEFMSSHTARRTGITLLIEKGVPLPMIQKITGHSDFKTLLKYDGTSINNLFAYLDDL